MEILGNLSDKMGSILVGFSTIALVVLALTEVLGTTFGFSGKRKALLSFVLGPAFAMLAYWTELVDVPLHGDDLSALSTLEHKARHWVGVAFLGFASTVLAKVVHDGVTGAGLTGKLKDAAAAVLKPKANGGA